MYVVCYFCHAPPCLMAQSINQSIKGKKALLMHLLLSYIPTFRQILQELTDLKAFNQDHFGHPVPIYVLLIIVHKE